jgi:flagellar biosynthetic protein FliQ
MSPQLVVDLARNAIVMALLVAAPMLIVALVLGLLVSVLQAVTQIQEQTLAFVPKLLGVSAVFLLALPWILQTLIRYTTELFRSIPSMAS